MWPRHVAATAPTFNLASEEGREARRDWLAARDERAAQYLDGLRKRAAEKARAPKGGRGLRRKRPRTGRPVLRHGRQRR